MAVAVVVAVVVARLLTAHHTVAEVVVVAAAVVVVVQVDHAVVPDIDVVDILDHDRVHVIVIAVEVCRHVNANVHAIRAQNEPEMAMVNEVLSVLPVAPIVVDPKHLARQHALDRVQNNVHLNDNHPVEPMDEVDRAVQASMIVVVGT